MSPRRSPKTRDPGIEQAARRARRLLHRRALLAGATSALPIPGLDWMVDVALLQRLIPRLSAEFGLLPNQIERLDPAQQERVRKAAAIVGSTLIGKVVTQELVLSVFRRLGLHLSSKQAARFVPLAGQAAAGVIGYATLRVIGERHIRDCIEVAQRARLALPIDPVDPTDGDHRRPADATG
jgi:uncharacterized protein (DUF697 family)